jgi:hypothetical protein
LDEEGEHVVRLHLLLTGIPRHYFRKQVILEGQRENVVFIERITYMKINVGEQGRLLGSGHSQTLSSVLVFGWLFVTTACGLSF